MKRTLLELVQAVASSISSDEINTIGDSPESLEIMEIVRSVYEELWTRTDLPEHYQLVRLVSSGDTDYPVLMTVPDKVTKIQWLRYNTETTDDTDARWTDIPYMPLRQFMEMTQQLRESDDDVDTFNYTIESQTFPVMYNNDRHPRYYTSVDDNTLLFDAHDITVDTTLQSNKTQAYAKLRIAWATDDDFIPELDANQFPLLLSEAKSHAWAELRQTPNNKIEQSAKRGWVRLQSTTDRAKPRDYYSELPNYGRK
jgi:hypothetical protein